MTESLERRVQVCALVETVFATFTDSDRFAAWWGEGSTIDPNPGGAVVIRYPNGIVASGTVEEIDAPRRIAFTFGYEDGKGPIPPGASRVEIELTPNPQGTMVRLQHHFDDPTVRDAHVPGWRYQLGLFANVVASAQHADLDGLFDRFFAAQSLEDASARREALEPLLTEDFEFRDTYACLRGVDDLVAHLTAARAHGASASIERRGLVRHCQGTALCDWVTRGPDGALLLEGSNVAQLAADGRLSRVSGLWEVPRN